MDANSLSQLSPEKLAALSDEQKAIFCSLSPFDQNFFASAYSEKDLAIALDRKGEIMKRNQGARERMEQLKKQFSENSALAIANGSPKTDEILTGIASAVGIGAAAAVVATDHTARWQGVDAKTLISPLRAEFEDKELTDISFDGSPDAMEGTVFLVSSGQPVPALTINLTRIENGVEVKVSNLTTQGAIETFRHGGQKLLSLAQKGFSLWNRKNRGLNPLDWISNADDVLNNATDAAETASNLKLEERAWRVIKNTAENSEKAYLDQIRQDREKRSEIERAWDEYRNCPTCSVPFAEGDSTCRVCGTARPPLPSSPDPRQK
jgi:hypothetical protein